jgi:hypothetical protein
MSRCLDNLTDGGEVVSLNRWPHFTLLVLPSVSGRVNLRAIERLEELGLKTFNDPIGNLTCDLPACSILQKTYVFTDVLDMFS